MDMKAQTDVPSLVERVARRILWNRGYSVGKAVSVESPQPLHSPWNSESFDKYFAMASPRTLVSRDRCYVLERMVRQTLTVPGDIIECGVYKGGTAAMIARILEECASEKKLYLFDTFEGMPETDGERDWHKKGDFSDTSLQAVKDFVGMEDRCVFKQGFIPETFAGMEDITISFCHIDVDIYRSILDCLNFAWPRMQPGGIIIFDDYGFPTCPGALLAVDEFFEGKDAIPLCLHTGQALVIKK
jgi:O-methyltransferase